MVCGVIFFRHVISHPFEREWLVRRLTDHSLSAILLMLTVCHWIVLTIAWLLTARAMVDSVAFAQGKWRHRILPLENLLNTLTDPILSPIRRWLSRIQPPWMDASPFAGAILCLLTDILIVWVSGRL